MEESKKTEENNVLVPTTKKAMSILHEWCTYRGCAPKYDFVKSEGHDHCPTFFYSVTAGELSAEGSSTSKRGAKHAAAQALLDIVAQNAAGQNGTLSSSVEAMDQDKQENPAGMLQEMCLAHGWPIPAFDKPQVVVTCRIGNREVTGYGAKKKQAKREAANAMIKLLQSTPNQDYWRSSV